MIKDAKWVREVIKIRIENEQLQKEVNDRCDKIVDFISSQKPINNRVSCNVVPTDYSNIWDMVRSEMIRRGFAFECIDIFYYFVLVL